MARTMKRRPPALPKSYIKRYGISKRAWAEYRKASGTKKKTKTKRRRNVYASSGKGVVRPGKVKTYCTTGAKGKGWKKCSSKQDARTTLLKAFAKKRKAKKTTSKKRKNPMARTSNPKRNAKGRFVKSGGRRRKARRNPSTRAANPKRRKARRNPSTRAANPKRRKARRSRNPSIAMAMGEVKRSLTSRTTLLKFAVGATGAIVSDRLGNKLFAYAAGMFPMIGAGTLGSVALAASKIATGAAVAVIIPSGYKQSYLIGAGASAIQGLAQPYLASIPGLSGLGMGGFLTTGSIVGGRAINGMGGWLTTGQARRLGMAV